jgi:hypothetical protein
MTHTSLANELAMTTPFISVIRRNIEPGAQLDDFPVKSGCALRILRDVLKGKRVVITEERCTCGGGTSGFGFVDGLHEMPGGIENFLTGGVGEGFPPGERLKSTPEVAKEMIFAMPTAVLTPYNAIEFKPYEPEDTPDLVTMLVDADQLTAFVNLYTYRTGAFDNIIMPMTAGCASVVRLPLGEARNAHPRAVIGNADITSRFYFDSGTFFLTVTGTRFTEMLSDADESFIFAPTFRGVKKRMEKKRAAGD